MWHMLSGKQLEDSSVRPDPYVFVGGKDFGVSTALTRRRKSVSEENNEICLI
jgi:hypothetical protein